MIILLSDSENTNKFASQVAKLCSLPLKLLKNSHDLRSLADNPYSALLLDFTNGLTDFQGVDAELIPNRTHALLNESDLITLRSKLNNLPVGTLLIKREDAFSEADAQAYAFAVSAINRPNPFGLQNLIPMIQNLESIAFSDSGQKAYAANAISSFLQQLNYNDQVIGAVASAVDELLMNAMFDSPTDVHGARPLEKVSRSESIETHGVEMQIGHTSDLIAVTVIDANGSLKRDEVLKQITDNLVSESNKYTQRETAGSGLGLTLTLRSGGRLFFACRPNHRTEVTVLFSNVRLFKALKSQAFLISTFVG